MQDQASVKSKMINLINSVRTLMRSALPASHSGVPWLCYGEADVDASSLDLPQHAHHPLGHCLWLSGQRGADKNIHHTPAEI